MSIHLQDVVILAHSPKSCTYLSYQSISSAGRRRLFERGTLLPSSLSPNIISTDMDEDDMVFGGRQKLTDTVTAILRQKPKPRAIVIISSCPAGIIGDDIDMAKPLAEPGIPVITIKTDGNLSGDYLQGMLMCYTELARQIIDPNVQPEPNTVNIVFEKVVAKNTENNFHIIRDYLDKMGIRVNCRFLCNTYYDELKNFRSASLTESEKSRARAYIYLSRLNSLTGLPKGVKFAVHGTCSQCYGYTAFLIRYFGMTADCISVLDPPRRQQSSSPRI